MPKVGPATPFRLVQGYHFYRISSWRCALDVERASGSREAENQAARTVFIRLIVLNDLTRSDRFFDFERGNTALEALIQSMERELVLKLPESAFDFVDHGAVKELY
ncbi:MAG TPA: hypothetical protein VNH18_09325 [Bryobacteraceae bacterium]|nr:hypothetical protein [Bryobacteraceae bacterium]